MTNYKVVNADQLDYDLSSVADAIRTVTGSLDSLSFPSEFVSAISGMTGGGGGSGLPEQIAAICCGTYCPTEDQTGEVCIPFSADEIDPDGMLGEPYLVAAIGPGAGTWTDGGMSFYACAHAPYSDDPYLSATHYCKDGFYQASASSYFSQFGDGGLRIKEMAGIMFAGEEFFWLAIYKTPGGFE